MVSTVSTSRSLRTSNGSFNGLGISPVDKSDLFTLSYSTRHEAPSVDECEFTFTAAAALVLRLYPEIVSEAAKAIGCRVVARGLRVSCVGDDLIVKTRNVWFVVENRVLSYVRGEKSDGQTFAEVCGAGVKVVRVTLVGDNIRAGMTSDGMRVNVRYGQVIAAMKDVLATRGMDDFTLERVIRAMEKHRSEYYSKLCDLSMTHLNRRLYAHAI